MISDVLLRGNRYDDGETVIPGLKDLVGDANHGIEPRAEIAEVWDWVSNEIRGAGEV
jgi:hypothetical protein